MAHTLSLHRLAAADPSDRTTSVLLRIGAAVLAVGLVAFGLLYYQDQHVAAVPSLVERQVTLTEAAVRKSPDDLQARLQLGEVYGQAARYDDAVTQFDQVLKVAPDSKDALLGKGFALMTQGELDKAVVPLTQIVKATRKGEFAGADSQLAAAYYYLGVIAVKQNKPDEALTQLGHALKIEPTDSDAMYQVGLAQLQKGANVEAIATFRNALRFVPTGWCEPYQQMQAAYTAMKKPELATYASAMAGLLRRQGRPGQDPAHRPHGRPGRRRRDARPRPHRRDLARHQGRGRLVPEGPREGPQEHGRDLRRWPGSA